MCEIYTDRPKEAELNDVILREAQSNDWTPLWEFLAIAAYEPSARAAQDVPVISVLLDGWKRPGDFGCIAELDGTAIGAAWARQFELDDKPAVYAGPEIPEITIGVRPEVHARGSVLVSCIAWSKPRAIAVVMVSAYLSVIQIQPYVFMNVWGIGAFLAQRSRIE